MPIAINWNNNMNNNKILFYLKCFKKIFCLITCFYEFLKICGRGFAMNKLSNFFYTVGIQQHIHDMLNM